MTVDQSTLWLQYLQVLSGSVTLQSGEALQAIYPFAPWDWGGRDATTGTSSYDQFEVLNAVPSVPNQNQASAPSPTQQGFDIAYQNWFNELAVGDLMHDSHYRALQDQLTDANNTYLKDYGNAQNTWLNQTGGNGVTLTAWLASAAGFSINNQLNVDQEDIKSVTSEMEDYRKRIQNPIVSIESAYGNTSYQGYVTDPNTSKSVQVRLWTTVPGSAYDYVEQITDDNFGGDAKKGNPVTVTLSSTTDVYDYQSYYAEAGGGAWWDFIGIEAGGSYSKIDWSQFDSEYSITFTFQDLATVPIAPEQWYAGTNITSFGQGPYADGFSAFQSGTKNYFFGPGGALSRIYTALIVGYRPTVTVTAGESLTTFLKEQWESEAGIEIGPFVFGGKAGGETEQSTVTTKDGSLVIESQADWPLIVAMKSAWTLVPPSPGA
jgi:hypothetical protein